MSTGQISVARDFSRFPAGRNRSDGDFSGERFREELLVPNLQKHDHLVIDLDGAAGYGSSFLEEAFGGLVRINKLTYDELQNRLEIKSHDATLLLEIWTYLREAAALKGQVR